jgi:hypothetical protein
MELTESCGQFLAAAAGGREKRTRQPQKGSSSRVVDGEAPPRSTIAARAPAKRTRRTCSQRAGSRRNDAQNNAAVPRDSSGASAEAAPSSWQAEGRADEREAAPSSGPAERQANEPAATQDKEREVAAAGGPAHGRVDAPATAASKQRAAAHVGEQEMTECMALVH